MVPPKHRISAFQRCADASAFIKAGISFTANHQNATRMWSVQSPTTSSVATNNRTPKDFNHQYGMYYSPLSRKFLAKARSYLLLFKTHMGFAFSFSKENNLQQPSCCCLPDPFRGMGAWRKTMEPQKPGNSPGSGPEVEKRQSRQRVSGAKSP